MNKTTIYSFFLLIFFSLTGFTKGHATFDILDIPVSDYKDEIFQGQDGSTWIYMQFKGNDITEKASTKNNMEVYISGNATIKHNNAIWTVMGNKPSLTITSPTSKAKLSPIETPTIKFYVANFDISTSATADDGNGYIQYQVDQDAYANYFSTNPIVLNNLDAGLHSVSLQLVDNNGDALDPEISRSVNFTTNKITEVSDIGALGSNNLGSYYSLTGEVTPTHQQNLRGQKHIQDATGAILIDDNDGVPTKKDNQYDGTPLSDTDLETASSIDIYPNPATDKFFVNVNSNTQIEVFSIIGKKVIHTQVANPNTPISIQSLKSGVYIIKITQDGTSTTKKLVIR